MPLPPQTIPVAIPRERYCALRAEAFRRGKTMQAILHEWIDPPLDNLPAAPGPEAPADDEDG